MKVLRAMRMTSSFLSQQRFVVALFVAAATLSAQELMTLSGDAQLLTSDATVLDEQENRKDLTCTVTPTEPKLGFNLKFRSGYEIAIPMKELAGTGNVLTMVFRVEPQNRPEEPVYFTQHINVPPLDEDAKGNAYLKGDFDVGEGKYHVSWLMRDRAEHLCSFNWDIEATLPSRDRQMALDIPAGAVRAAETEPFKEEAPVQRDAAEPLTVKVMVNFAPQAEHSASMQPVDVDALVQILRNVARERRIGRFSLVAFNMQEQRVIYRQDDASQIDFPALGEALKSLNLGTVDLKLLGQKSVGTDFLAQLLSHEISPDKAQPDAVIIAGPKVMLDEHVPADSLRELGQLSFPVFYMNYNADPQVNPWRDAIGAAVRTLKGAEYTISRPRDLFFAWTEIMSRIVKSKGGRTVAGNGSSAQ